MVIRRRGDAGAIARLLPRKRRVEAVPLPRLQL
jgi:hypothetical protein